MYLCMYICNISYIIWLLAPEFLTKKHKVFEVNWLFDTYLAPDSALQLDPKKYIEDIKDTEKKILALKVILENAIFAGKDYENFVQREQKIKVCLLFPSL